MCSGDTGQGVKDWTGGLLRFQNTRVRAPTALLLPTTLVLQSPNPHSGHLSNGTRPQVFSVGTPWLAESLVQPLCPSSALQPLHSSDLHRTIALQQSWGAWGLGQYWVGAGDLRFDIELGGLGMGDWA